MAVPLQYAASRHNKWDALQTGRCIADAILGREGLRASSTLDLSQFRNPQNEALRRKSNTLAGRVRFFECAIFKILPKFLRTLRVPPAAMILLANTNYRELKRIFLSRVAELPVTACTR